MRLFEISGIFEQNGHWSGRDADFIGYFVQREKDVIEGYVEEQFPTPYDKIRYIKGVFIDDTKLAFLKLCNDSELSPLAYIFRDIHKDGFWDGYSIFRGFFFNGCYQGHAKVTIEEVISEQKKEELSQKTLKTFSQKIVSSPSINHYLLDDSMALRYLLDNSKRLSWD